MSDPSIGLNGWLWRILSIFGGVILGAATGFITVKAKVGWLQNNVKELKESVRFSDTCDEIHKAISRELKDIKKSQATTEKEVTATRVDIGKLLERTKKL